MPCRICEGRTSKEYEVKEMMFGLREVFTYVQCQKCNSLQIKNIPKNLSKYYPNNYYSLSINPEKEFSNPLMRFIRKERAKYAIFNKGVIGRVIYSRFPDPALRSLSQVTLSRKTKILDVGCGSGIIPYTLINMGFENVTGIDLYVDKEREKGKVKILKRKIDEMEGEWGIIMFHHSLEHMEDPVETLRKAHKLLDEEGTCIVRVPMISSYAWKKYKTDWVQLDAPRHIFIPSIEGIKMLVAESFFKIEKIVYDSTAFQFYGSEQYLRDIPLMSNISYAIHPRESIFSRSEIKKMRKAAKLLNKRGEGDSVAVYLKNKK